MNEVVPEIKPDVIKAVLARLQKLLSYGGTAAQVTAPGVAIILSGMKKEDYDGATIDYLTQELHATHPQVNLVDIIAHFQQIYDRL